MYLYCYYFKVPHQQLSIRVKWAFCMSSLLMCFTREILFMRNTELLSIEWSKRITSESPFHLGCLEVDSREWVGFRAQLSENYSCDVCDIYWAFYKLDCSEAVSAVIYLICMVKWGIRLLENFLLSLNAACLLTVIKKRGKIVWTSLAWKSISSLVVVLCMRLTWSSKGHHR